MTTVRVPSLNGSDKIWTEFYGAELRRVSDAALLSTKGAASGICALDASAFVSYANCPVGSLFELRYNGTAWPGSRPSARTDIYFKLIATPGTTPPGWFITGDRLSYKDD